jgi:hypothetical protein
VVQVQEAWIVSKYRARGPYHFVDYASGQSAYFHHVNTIVGIIRNHFIGIPRIHEIGCGEGLILQQLRNVGCIATGNDIDPEAIRIAKLLLGGPWVSLTTGVAGEGTPPGPFDLALFSDSLEHILTWEDHLRWAKNNSNHVLIAVPSEEDPHASQEFRIDSFDKIMDSWNKEQSFTANKRHVIFYCKGH